MKCRFEESCGIGLLTVQGDVGLHDEAELKNAFLLALDNAEHLIVDLNRVTVVDCCINQHIRILREISSFWGKRLTLLNCRPKARGLSYPARHEKETVASGEVA